MARQANRPRSLYEALNLYSTEVQASESETKAYATSSQIQTALLRYVLPSMGFPAPKGKKITELEKQSGLEALKQVPLEKIQEAPELLNRSFVNLNLSKGSQRTQRHTLNRFVTWCQSQSWWLSSAQKSGNEAAIQRKAKQIRTATQKKQKPYGLQATRANQIPQQLQQEFEEFYEFRVNPPSQALVSAVKAETAKNDLKNVDLFLGWLHHHQGLPIGQLTLENFMPSYLIEYEDVEQGDRFVPVISGYITEYISWLMPNSENTSTSQENRSQYTIINLLQTSIAVIKFLHYKNQQIIKRSDYENIQEIQAIRSEIRRIQRNLRNKIFVIKESEKTLDWVDFLQLVEALRLECEPLRLIRKSSNKDLTKPSSRTLSAVAQSFQRFLIVAFYAYFPLYSRITYRVLNFFASNASWEVRDYLTFNKGYLFFYENIWWIKLFGSLNESKELKRPPILKVPNLTYPDETSFYDYLNFWLVHYPCSDEGVTKGGLRACFHPRHSFIFTKKNGDFYREATDFANVIRNASYRIIGKSVTPNSIKRAFTFYMQSQGYSEALITSLSNSIGYKNDDLRKIYSEQMIEAELELAQRLGMID